MKHVFKTDELPHVWLHSSDSVGHGKNTSDNTSFHGDKFYSYGTVIAEKVTLKKQDIILLDVTSYSVTTSDRQSALNYACRGCETLPVWNDFGGRDLIPYLPKHHTAKENRETLKPWAVALFERYLKEAGRAQLSADKRRSQELKDSDLAEVAEWLKRAQRIKELTGLRHTVPENGKDVAEAQTRARATEKRARARQEKKRLADSMDKLEDWKRGILSNYQLGYLDTVFFRLIEVMPKQLNGEEVPVLGTVRYVETSKGAIVTEEEARTAWKFATLKRSKGWKRNGETCPVGIYQLDRVSESGIVAGCHSIKWDILNAFAVACGWDK